MAMGNLNKSKETTQTATTALKVATLEDHYPQKIKSPFWTKIYIVKVPLNVKIVEQDLLHRKQFLKILRSEVQKGGF